MEILRDHPDIESALLNGYPTWNQPTSHYCEECGKCLDDEDIYADGAHDYLCSECLLMLHEKSWW